MEHSDATGKSHAYMPALAVAIVAVVVIGGYVAWDISENTSRAKQNSRAVQDVNQELLKTRVESQTARFKVSQTEQDLQNTQTELKQVKQKLEDALAEAPQRRPFKKEPAVIITQREFAEQEYDETLKRAMFKTPRAEAERMVEKPIILLEDSVEIPESIRKLKEAKPEKCKKCSGEGWIACPHCGEEVPCYRCAGKGVMGETAAAPPEAPSPYKTPATPPAVKPAPEQVERAVGLAKGGKYERDAREMAASQALGMARYFDLSNQYEDKEKVAAKYKEVVEKYPGTAAAAEAAKLFESVMQRRK